MEEEMKEMALLMKQIASAMATTQKKEEAINKKRKSLADETKMYSYKELKTEIANLETDKKEYDEMTVKALQSMKQKILTKRRTIEKDNTDKLTGFHARRLDIQKRKNEIIRKRDLQLARGGSEERLAKINGLAERALIKVNNELAKVDEEQNQWKDEYTEQKRLLDVWDKQIEEDAVELGVVLNVSAEIDNSDKGEGKDGKGDDGKGDDGKGDDGKGDDGKGDDGKGDDGKGDDGKGDDGKGNPNPSNLPLKSGLQVYRALLNEVGTIKGTKAIAAHDFINKFNFLGINKLVAWGIRKATGRKGEIERLVELLDAMPREDFNLMMDDFLLKDNDIRGIIDHKVNEILLEAIEKKCERDFINSDPTLGDNETRIDEAFKKLQLQLAAARAKGQDTTALEARLVTLGVQKSQIHKLRERLESRSRKVRDGREAKSYDRKNNIRGGLRANRNPDNKEEINELADLELKVLQARRDGDRVAESQALAQMEDYRASQTEYITGRNGKIKASIGAFDSKKGEVKVISNQKNIAPELLGSISLIAASAGLAYLSALQQQQAIQGNIGSTNLNAPEISDKTVQTAQDSLHSDVVDIQALSERGSSLGSGFDHSSQTYATLDQAGVDRASNAFNNIQNFNTGKGSNLQKLAEIFTKKAEIAGAHQEAMNGVADGATAFYSNGNNVISSLNIDHAITSAVEQQAATYAGTNAQFYSDMAKILEGFNGMGSQALQQQLASNPDLLPIIIASIPGVSKTVQEVANARGARREADSELEPYDDGRD